VKLEQLRLRVKAATRILESDRIRRNVHPTDLLLDQLRRVSARLFRTQEEERSTIARALHEGVAQDLSSVLLQLGIAKTAGPERSSEILQSVAATTEGAIRRVRSLAYMLYPLLLDEIGLVAALHHYADAVWSGGDTEIELLLAPDFGRVDADVERALFRIAQEGVENAKLHSGSARASIQLARDGDDADEQGLFHAPEGVGILAMRERAEQAGGRLEVRSGPGGTTVRAALPAFTR
jgi:signal transduction histidine kinase